MFPRLNSRRVCTAMLFVAACFVLGAGFRAMFDSRFEAVARIQVGLPSAEKWGKEMPPHIAAEFKAIYSEASLKQAALRLNPSVPKPGDSSTLDNAASLSQAVASLRESMAVQPVRNTSLIEIRGRSQSPEEAARIANAIAEVRCEHGNVKLIARANPPSTRSHADRPRGFQFLGLSLVLLVVGGFAWRSESLVSSRRLSSGSAPRR